MDHQQQQQQQPMHQQEIQQHQPQQYQPQQYQPQQEKPPMAQQPMQHAPGQHRPTGPAQGWSNSLMDCSPLESCLLGCFLPCILFGRTEERLRDPTGQTHETINSECAIFGAIQCATGCGWVYNMMKRGELRQRYNIEGSSTGDCCTSYWCLCCAVIQQDKEVSARLNANGPVTQGYQSNTQGMHMPGQQHPHQQQQYQPQQQQHHPSDPHAGQSPMYVPPPGQSHPQ